MGEAGPEPTALAAVAPLDPRALAEALASPYALERYSVLTGEALLVADLRDAPAPSAAACESTRAALARLACPTFALAAGDGPAERALAAAFDVVVPDARALAPLVSRVARAPLAAQALAQLLRQGDFLDLHHALVAESLVYATLQAGPEFAAWLAGAERPARAASPTRPAVRIDRFGPELVLTLDRPERHNAFSVEMRDALAEALAMAVADGSVESIVLRGEGASFSSGGDLAEFGDLPDPATAHAVRSTRNPARLLSLCAERTTARVHGACIGAGVELPAFARRVVAAEDAFFALPELAMGLVPGAGGTASLPRRIGRQRTCWLALSGERIDADTALCWGLVDELGR